MYLQVSVARMRLVSEEVQKNQKGKNILGVEENTRFIFLPVCFVIYRFLVFESLQPARPYTGVDC